MPLDFECECGRRGKVADTLAGRQVKCPQCGRVQRLAVKSEPIAAPAVGDRSLCAICQSPLGAGECTASCPDCQAVYHADCWEENQGCAVYGCSEVPETEKLEVSEIPAAYWGREWKPCPKCKAEIMAVAVRCKNCGATFASARPEAAAEFRDRRRQHKRMPGLQKAVVFLFIASVIPCLAPLAAVGGGFWYLANSEDIEALPGVYRSLGKMAFGVSLALTIMTAIAVFTFALARRG